MGYNFFLVGRQRKISLAIKVLFLTAVVTGLVYGYLGRYLPIELWHILTAFLCTSILLNLARFFTVTAYRRRTLLPVGVRDNFVLGIDSISALILFLVTITSTFIVFEIAFQTFFASISLVAVALVLIFKDYISNYLDSFRLMFSADYRIGDYIKVSEFTKGNITDVTFRATKLKTDDGDVLFIPNTKLMTSEVVNYSKTKFKRITVPFSLPTADRQSVLDLEAALRAALTDQFPELVKDKKMFLRVLNIKHWQTEFAFEVSVDRYNFSIEEQVIKAVYLTVLSWPQSVAQPPTVLVAPDAS